MKSFSGIRADVLVPKSRPDGLGGSITERCSRVTVILPEGGPFEPTDDAPAVRIVKRIIAGREVVHAEPVDGPQDADRTIGPMSGPAHISTSDSRFSRLTGVYGAVALHDRFETPEVYEALSRD